MAVINLVFGIVGGKGGPTSHAPILRETAAETITSAVTSTQSSNTAQAAGYGESCPAVTINTDTAIWVKTGANPTAVSSTCRYVAAGQIVDLFLYAGDKVAVLEA